MKRNHFINFIKSGRFLTWLFLMLLSVVTGGSSLMAVGDNVAPQIGDEGNTPATATEVADKEPVVAGKSDLNSPGGKNNGQDLTGSQASSTQLNEGGMIEEEWDRNIVKFYPYKTPLLSIARQVAVKVPIKNWTAKHMRIGGETLDGKTTAEITGGDTIELNSTNFSGSLRPFYKCSTVYVPDVEGYKEGSTTEREGILQLYVIESNGKKVTLQATNGKAKNNGTPVDDLDSMTCPDIPSGSVFLVGATAASESQLMVPPENLQPREKEICVQKKLLNILFTTDFEKVQTKVPITVNDLKADAIMKYNLRAERSYWLGSKRRFKVLTEDGAVEDVYIAEGILPQLTNAYAIGDVQEWTDWIALSKLQFTDFAENNHAYVFAGKNYIERMEKMKIDKDGKNDIINHDEFDLTFKRIKDTFGTFDVVWDQTLDLMHMEDFAVIIDLKASRRYVRVANKERTNDMSKGAGAIRDAKRWIHEEADCIALRGYNSVLVGPEDKISKLGMTTLRTIISAPKFPDTPSNGMKVALTEDYTSGDVQYEKGTVYYYNGTKWELYKGQDVAV